jgi:hypothetical protein
MRLIQLVEISGYIKDGEAPLSINLIANPESGKTKMIQSFLCPQTFETSDLSAKMITDVIIPKLEKNEIHHIIIPDMIKVLSHKKDTVESTITFLNALMEEGIKQQTFFGQSFSMSERKKCGLVTSMTPDFFYLMFRFFHRIGHDTRYLPVSFTYSNDTIFTIHKAICDGLLFDELTKMKTITKKNIIIPKDIATSIMNLVLLTINNQKKDFIRVQTRGGKQKLIPIEFYGFRLQKQYRKLIQSIALIDGRKIVDQNDLNEFLSLVDYIRLPKNPKEI